MATGNFSTYYDNLLPKTTYFEYEIMDQQKVQNCVCYFFDISWFFLAYENTKIICSSDKIYHVNNKGIIRTLDIRGQYKYPIMITDTSLMYLRKVNWDNKLVKWNLLNYKMQQVTLKPSPNSWLNQFYLFGYSQTQTYCICEKYSNKIYDTNNISIKYWRLGKQKLLEQLIGSYEFEIKQFQRGATQIKKFNHHSMVGICYRNTLVEKRLDFDIVNLQEQTNLYYRINIPIPEHLALMKDLIFFTQYEIWEIKPHQFCIQLIGNIKEKTSFKFVYLWNSKKEMEDAKFVTMVKMCDNVHFIESVIPRAMKKNQKGTQNYYFNSQGKQYINNKKVNPIYKNKTKKIQINCTQNTQQKQYKYIKQKNVMLLNEQPQAWNPIISYPEYAPGTELECVKIKDQIREFRIKKVKEFWYGYEEVSAFFLIETIENCDEWLMQLVYGLLTNDNTT